MASEETHGASPRNAVVLAVAAAAAVGLAAFYFWGGAPTVFDLMRVLRGGDRIAPGFVGVAQFGHWRLICVPGPPPLNGLSSATAVPASVNACRVNGEMPAPASAAPAVATPVAVGSPTPPVVLVAANFSMVGPMKRPALMLRLPPTARAGDAVGLRLDGGYGVHTVVRDCTPQQCLAAGALSDEDWARLVVTKALQISFPAANGQGVLVDLPVDGLTEAAGALARAQARPAR
jgi:hypothetical protein